MVQLLLVRASTWRATVLLACLLLLWCVPAALGRSDKGKKIANPPDILLEGDRKLSWVQSFASEREVRGKLGFWTKVLDVVAGEPDYHRVIRPYGIAVDSRGRVIVADPGAMGVHVFDFVEHKYKFLDRKDKSKLPMRTPQCVAVDAEDNIYITDSEAGEISFLTHTSISDVRSVICEAARVTSNGLPASPWIRAPGVSM